MGSESTLLPTNGSASFADIKLDPSATTVFYKLVGDPLSTPGYKSTEPLPVLFERVVKEDDPKAMVMLARVYK